MTYGAHTYDTSSVRAVRAALGGGRLLELVLEDKEVVGGGYGDDTLVGVPCCMKDFLVEVQAVYAYLVLRKCGENFVNILLRTRESRKLYQGPI